MSLKGGASDGFLTWDGSNLNIQGSINITGGATADTIELLNVTTESLQTGVNNSVLSGSKMNRIYGTIKCSKLCYYRSKCICC